MYNITGYTVYVYNITKEGCRMASDRDWFRETRDSINTGFRIPKYLYQRFQRYKDETGLSKTEIMIRALKEYLPEYDEEGGVEK